LITRIIFGDNIERLKIIRIHFVGLSIVCLSTQFLAWTDNFVWGSRSLVLQGRRRHSITFGNRWKQCNWSLTVN
jgi:hypothetical protein